MPLHFTLDDLEKINWKNIRYYTSIQLKEIKVAAQDILKKSKMMRSTF